jgi:hypothetical protein
MPLRRSLALASFVASLRLLPGAAAVLIAVGAVTSAGRDVGNEFLGES